MRRAIAERLRGALSLPVALCLAACGGGTNPTAPAAPTPAPTPTPVSRVSFTLSAPADHYQFSVRLAPLFLGHDFDVAVRPTEINDADGAQYGNSVELWLLSSDSSETADYTTDGVALSLTWARGTTWIVDHREPGAGYSRTNTQVDMALGHEYGLRVSRRDDGSAEFFFEGNRVLQLSDSSTPKYVFTRVIGATAQFSYLPRASSARGWAGSYAGGEGPALIAPPARDPTGCRRP